MRVTNRPAWARLLLRLEGCYDWASVTSYKPAQGGLLISSAHTGTLDAIATFAQDLGLTVERAPGSVKVMAL